MNEEDFPRRETKGPSNYVRSQGLVTLAIEDFHDKFNLARLVMDKETLIEYLTTRLSFIMEELGEVASELNRGQPGKAVLELADLLFVVEGTFHTLGEWGDRACAQVIMKNQSKDPSDWEYDPTNGKLIRKDA